MRFSVNSYLSAEHGPGSDEAARPFRRRPCRQRGHPPDRGTVPDPRAGPDTYPEIYGHAHADLGKIFDRDLAGKQSTGRQIHAFSDLSVMGYDHTRIDQRPETNCGFGADIALRQHLNAVREPHRIFHKSGRMDQCRERKTQFLKPFKDFPADGIIADPTDCINSGIDPVRPQFRKQIRIPEHRDPGNLRTGIDAVVDDPGDIPIPQPQQGNDGLCVSARTVDQNPSSHDPILIQKRADVNLRRTAPHS